MKQLQYSNKMECTNSSFINSSIYSTPKNFKSTEINCKTYNAPIAQPLYANAPPKPRRAIDSLDEHPQIAQPQYKHVSLMNSIYKTPLNSSERRTPDDYGRNDIKYPNPSEYEEVIDEYRPFSVNYREKKYTYRPHSADFLDYDSNQMYKLQTLGFTDNKSFEYNTVGKSNRPKSSLDFVDDSDSYWSENAYAEKMRQASLSLNKDTKQNINRSVLSLKQSGIYLNNVKMEPLGECSFQMKNQRNFIKEQEKRWSEYVNSFNRSASARVPRKIEKSSLELSKQKRSTSLQRRNSVDSRDKEKKSQQVCNNYFILINL